MKRFRISSVSRSTKYSTNMVLTIILIMCILVLIEAFSMHHNWRYDTTADKRYSLSSQSKKILQGIKEPVRAYAFFQEGDRQRRVAEDLLEQYARQSKYFKYEFIDPDRHPGEAKKYNITTYNSIVLQRGPRQEKVMVADEERITNALLKVSRDTKKEVYFLKGHGEKSIDDHGPEGFNKIKKALEDENYSVKELLLVRETNVPEEATLLIIGGPKKDPSPEEMEAIKRYIEGGKNLLVLIDPETAESFVPFLKGYGFLIGKDVIIDKRSRLFGADYVMPVVTTYGDHPITQGFNLATFFPVARSVEATNEPKGVEEAKSIAMTGTDSWAETDLERVKRKEAAFEDGKDRRGPISIAAISTFVSKKEKDGGLQEITKSHIVVFGDSDFVDNSHLHPSFGNRDLFINTVNWLTGEKELISIRPREQDIVPMMLTSFQGRVMFWVPVVFLPMAVLFTGITLLAWRRWRR